MELTMKTFTNSLMSAAAIFLGASALAPAQAGPIQSGPMIRTPTITAVVRPTVPVQSAASASQTRTSVPTVPGVANAKPAGFGQGGGALGAIGSGQAGKLGGLLPGGGNPGSPGNGPGAGPNGLGKIGASDIIKGMNGSTATGRAQEAAKGIPGSQGIAKGRQAGDGVSGRNVGVIKQGVESAKASAAGQAKGVQRDNETSARNGEKISIGVATAKEMQGVAVGRQKDDGGPQLSKGQQAQLKESLKSGAVNPKINQSDDGKGGGKGAGGGKGQDQFEKTARAVFNKEVKDANGKPFVDKVTGAKVTGTGGGNIVFGDQKGGPKPNPKIDAVLIMGRP